MYVLPKVVSGNFQPMPLTLLVVPFLDNTLVRPHLTRQPQEVRAGVLFDPHY